MTSDALTPVSAGTPELTEWVRGQGLDPNRVKLGAGTPALAGGVFSGDLYLVGDDGRFFVRDGEAATEPFSVAVTETPPLSGGTPPNRHPLWQIVPA